MKNIDFKKINKQKKYLLDTMLDFISDEEGNIEKCADYNKNDIEKCKIILSFNELERLYENENTKREYILSWIEEKIKKLNKLNIKCNSSLIETEQREIICNILNHIALCVGLIKIETEDITENLREW